MHPAARALSARELLAFRLHDPKTPSPVPKGQVSGSLRERGFGLLRIWELLEFRFKGVFRLQERPLWFSIEGFGVLRPEQSLGSLFQPMEDGKDNIQRAPRYQNS